MRTAYRDLDKRGHGPGMFAVAPGAAGRSVRPYPLMGPQRVSRGGNNPDAGGLLAFHNSDKQVQPRRSWRKGSRRDRRGRWSRGSLAWREASSQARLSSLHPSTGSRRAVRAAQEPANRLRGGLVRDAEPKTDRVVREAGRTEPRGLRRHPLVDRWRRHRSERLLDQEARVGAQPLRAGLPQETHGT